LTQLGYDVDLFVDRRFTMAMLSKGLLFPVSVLVSLLVASLVCHGGELIPPSQTLQGPRQIPAKLTVLSEPPGLKVFLDGSEIGKTPVRQRQVKAGSYTLRVKDSETEIEAGPGEELKISLFKGSFIHIPKTERAAEKQPGLEQEEIEVTKTPEPAQEQRPTDLTPWERFINGTSRHF
jgi:hypothetical protein